jgi:hypothetical protein
VCHAQALPSACSCCCCVFDQADGSAEGCLSHGLLVVLCCAEGQRGAARRCLRLAVQPTRVEEWRACLLAVVAARSTTRVSTCWGVEGRVFLSLACFSAAGGESGLATKLPRAPFQHPFCGAPWSAQLTDTAHQKGSRWSVCACAALLLRSPLLVLSMPGAQRCQGVADICHNCDGFRSC